MNKRIQTKDGYEEAPAHIQREMERSVILSPEEFQRLLHPVKKKITIAINESSIERFKAAAKKTGVGYQALINDVLDSYAKTKLS